MCLERSPSFAIFLFIYSESKPPANGRFFPLPYLDHISLTAFFVLKLISLYGRSSNELEITFLMYSMICGTQSSTTSICISQGTPSIQSSFSPFLSFFVLLCVFRSPYARFLLLGGISVSLVSGSVSSLLLLRGSCVLFRASCASPSFSFFLLLSSFRSSSLYIFNVDVLRLQRWSSQTSKSSHCTQQKKKKHNYNNKETFCYKQFLFLPLVAKRFGGRLFERSIRERYSQSFPRKQRKPE